ncbi:unnamed protein product [Camellia sinensis]
MWLKRLHVCLLGATVGAAIVKAENSLETDIFNSKLVLASPEIATDADYATILGVIGHEFSLKEGLTVFRDQECSSNLGSCTVKRIADVSRLRNYQFPQ